MSDDPIEPHRHMLAPRPGFNWQMVNWGGPNEPASDDCSYCGDEIPEDCVPLILWNKDGWCARFCDHCMATWWGIKTLPPEPDDDGL